MMRGVGVLCLGSQRKDRRNSSTGGGGAKGKRCRADSTDTTTDMTPGDGMPCSKVGIGAG